MRHSIRVLAGMAVSAAVFTSAAYAQDMTTYSFGGTTLYIGGGVQFLSLPDIKFTGRLDTNDHFRHQKNSDFSEYGPAAGAGIETAIGYWNGMRLTAGVKGLYTWLENSDSKRCASTGSYICAAFDPTGQEIFGVDDSFRSKTDRDVDCFA